MPSVLRRNKGPDTAPTGMPAWRLETFDLRAGLAFATYREAHQGKESAKQVGDWPCLHFAPPNFEPQPIDNIAIALAASRRGFDAGLIVDDAEVGFDSPADVGEFVRRAYVASAGGDGDDSGGGGVPVRPDGGDLPPRKPRFGRRFMDEGERASKDFVSGLHGAVRDYCAFPGTGHREQISHFWSALKTWDAAPAMRRGARSVFLELLDRCPSVPDSDPWLIWANAVRAFGQIAAPCTSWNDFLDVMDDASMYQRLRDIDWELGNHDPANWKAKDLLYGLLYRTPGPRLADPIDALSQFPAPACCQRMDPGYRTSVFDLLIAVCSSPQAALERFDFEAFTVGIDVTVFAAACLVGDTSDAWGPWLDPWTRLDMAALHRGKLSARAVEWLIGQLPRRRFEPALEKVIFDARHITYAKPATEDAHHGHR